MIVTVSHSFTVDYDYVAQNVELLNAQYEKKPKYVYKAQKKEFQMQNKAIFQFIVIL